jgi:hypothetical protein
MAFDACLLWSTQKKEKNEQKKSRALLQGRGLLFT